MRDILLFPNIDNINIIQKIRLKYDKLAQKISPHITIVFPFEDDITNEELYNKLILLTNNIECFNISLKGIILTNDKYVVLKVVMGSDKIKELHDCIYKDILPKYLRDDIEYIPHLTLGQANDLTEFSNFCFEFTGIVDSIFIEEIGSNEESIIVKEIKLKKLLKKY